MADDIKTTSFQLHKAPDCGSPCASTTADAISTSTVASGQNIPSSFIRSEATGGTSRAASGENPSDDAVVIPLTKGYSTVIDKADYPLVSQYRWQATLRRKGRVYARRGTWVNGRRVAIYLHRLLLQPKSGEVIDHIDCDGLNNRRSNIRICTTQQNLARAPQRLGRTGYRGVWRSRYGFSAFVTHKRNRYYIGYFKTSAEAALAYNRRAFELFGEFAVLNTIAERTAGCSWCRKFMDEHSSPIGNIIPEMNQLKITHGICRECYAAMKRQIKGECHETE